MREPPCSLEEVENYDFLQAWKTDDLDWLNQRRNQWPAIQKKIEQIHKTFDDKDLGLNKTHYKSIKSFYLTGFIRPVTEEERKTWVFNFPSEASGGGHKLGLIFAFWLSPDHSWENWQRLKSAHMYAYNPRLNIKDGAVSDFKIKHNTINLRRLVRCHPGTKPWPNFESRGRQVSPYKGSDVIIEDNVMKTLIKGLPIDEVDDRGYSFNPPINDYMKVLKGYLGGGDARYADFNPNNPIIFFLDELIEYLKNYGKDETSEDSFKHIKTLFTLIFYVAKNNNQFHSLQVEVANKMKTGIYSFKNSVNKIYQSAIDQAIDMSNERIPNAFYSHSLWKTREDIIEWYKENGKEDESENLKLEFELMDQDKQAKDINEEHLEYRAWFENR